MDQDERPHLFDDPRNVRRVIYALCTVCAAFLLLDLFIERPVEHPWEALFGFYAVYGFTACVGLVLIAKELRRVLMRREDYYDD